MCLLNSLFYENNDDLKRMTYGSVCIVDYLAKLPRKKRTLAVSAHMAMVLFEHMFTIMLLLIIKA